MSNDFMDLFAAGLATMVDDELEISAAGWLCIAIARMYGTDTAEEDRAQAITAVSRLLDGVCSRGFANTGTLLTLAANGMEPRQFARLAREAMEGITPEEVDAAVGPMQQAIHPRSAFRAHEGGDQ